MKKSIKNLFVLLLVGLFVLTPVVAEAARFSDVEYGHWAYDYIEELSGKGVVKGYPDGKFHPDKYVSYLEILELLKGVKNLPEYEMNQYVEKYKTVMERYGVPDWAYPAVAVALGEEIITVDNLMAAYSQGLITDFAKDDKFPSRETIAVYYAKALGLKGIDNHEVLKYKDIDEIGKINNPLIDKIDVKDYLANLIVEGIFADTGSDGFFAPQRPLRRSEMAKITDLSYKLAHRKTTDIEGRIIHLGDVHAKNLIFIEDDNDNSYTIIINENTKIKIDDKDGSYDDFKLNQKVKAKVTGDVEKKELLNAVELTIETNRIEGTGIIDSIDTEKIKLSYKDKLQAIHPDKALDVEFTESFGYDPNLEIVQIDQEKNFKDLAVGMRVRFIAENGLVKKIFIVPNDVDVSGTVVKVKSDSKFEKDGILTLKLSNDTEYDFYVDSQQKFGVKPSQLKDLKKDDKVKIRAFYDFIGEINDNAYPKTTVGYIQDVVTHNNQYHDLTLMQLDGKAIKVKVDQSTKFVDNALADRPLNADTLTSLRNNKTRVNVSLSGNRATYLEATNETVKLVSGNLSVTSVAEYEDQNNYTLNGTIRLSNYEVKDVIIRNPQGLEIRKNYEFEGFEAGNNIIANIDGQPESFVFQIQTNN